ncbi:hypothetical protein EQM13_06855 [Acidilutibacter cellobiosedens]|jgi:adenylate kinase family enzyme|uniref:DNA topology modulation protein FlaR n=1 Tax=Acidilutibacter cellobiosedens TaxID=2507161 RepID=A0A410QBK0_9FIRM|nr:AAA family ATPase [Acidilutibacter cellobiosedens]MBE6082150.1 hypothetical protein [Tissierellaceae bacterium]QAT61330.1 hypothetical protein EQM13_06855 [Acidilutibacter cellobiosedens]
MKILIFGIVASGKTTLARKLSKELSIPYYEGDCIAWGFPNEKRYKRSNEEQKEIIDKINENGAWIVEGTYRESQKVLYDLADKIIFLDTPLYIRRYRIISRFIKQKVGYEKSNYKPTYDMLKHMFIWTNDFEKNRNVHEDRLMDYENKLLWIKSVNELKGKL